MTHERISLVLLVVRPDGPKEQLVISEPRVLVGAGAHCDIRIDEPEAAYEHVELLLDGESVHARAMVSAPAVLLGDATLASSTFSGCAELRVCGTRIVVTVVREGKRQPSRPVRRALTAFVVTLALIVAPAVVYAALGAGGEDRIGPPPAPVALWDDAAPSCRVRERDQALYLAKRERNAAEAKRERYPFAVEDGAAAVVAFETAAACDRAAGNADDAGKDDLAARALRSQVARDYHAHRIRLAHAIETEDLVSALREARIVRKMTAGRRGPFVEWLAVVERRLDMQLRRALAEKEKPQ